MKMYQKNFNQHRNDIHQYFFNIYLLYTGFIERNEKEKKIPNLRYKQKFYYKLNLIGRQERSKAGHFHLLLYLILPSKTPS